MKTLFLPIAVLAGALLAEPPTPVPPMDTAVYEVRNNNAPLLSASLWTNRVGEVVAMLPVQPILTSCPVCGAPNHHATQPIQMRGKVEVYARVVTATATNNLFLTNWLTGTNWTEYQLIPADRPQQPGFRAVPRRIAP